MRALCLLRRFGARSASWATTWLQWREAADNQALAGVCWSSQRSASSAAMQPKPAEVIAWR